MVARVYDIVLCQGNDKGHKVSTPSRVYRVISHIHISSVYCALSIKTEIKVVAEVP